MPQNRTDNLNGRTDKFRVIQCPKLFISLSPSYNERHHYTLHPQQCRHQLNYSFSLHHPAVYIIDHLSIDSRGRGCLPPLASLKIHFHTISNNTNMNIARPRPPTTESTSKPPAGRRKLGDQPPDNNTNNSRGKSTGKKNNANRKLDQLGFTSSQVDEIEQLIESSKSSNLLKKNE